MKKFLISVVIFCAVFFIADKAFILVRNASAGLEADKRLEQVVNGQINADVLIFGSSRGARNVIASQMTDSLGEKVFNLSYPGSDIEFHDYLLQQILKYDHHPKTVVLVVDGVYELTSNATITFRYDRLYPLVKYEPIRNTLVEKGMKNRLLMDLFVLHQLNLNNFLLYQKKFSQLDTVFSDGSMPVSAALKHKKFTGQYEVINYTYDTAAELKNKQAAFRSFIDQCYNNHIKLILAFPPNFSAPSAEATARLGALAGGKASMMLYDTTQKAYTDPAYFYDNGHLNRSGAVIYTNELIDYLKKFEAGQVAVR